MKKRVIILGGYGATGRALARLLLQRTDVDLIIAGRNEKKATEFVATLKQDFPSKNVKPQYADASKPESLKPAFEVADFVMVTATVPDHIEKIARAALDAGCDFLDIMVSTDVIRKLEPLTSRIIDQHRLFITQGGFHPGLIAPAIRYAAMHFDRIEEANVAMSMNVHLPNSASAKEIVDESYDYRPIGLRDGQWKELSYKDTLDVDFGKPYGVKTCLPMHMEEIMPLREELGVKNMTVYVSGFNWFVDNVVFGLIYLAGKIKKRLFSRTFQRMLKWGIDKFSPAEEWILFKVEASGMKNGTPHTISLSLQHEDGYLLTAACILAFFKQYLNGQLPEEGLHRMGNAANPQHLIDDLAELGFPMAPVPA